MEKLVIVAAIGKNNELGLENCLIWKIPEDLAFYKKMTYHENVIMGRKTLESMPSAALENRNIFVLSKRPLEEFVAVTCFKSVEELLKYIEMSDQTFIVAGGAQVYEALMPYADVMYLTEIDEYAAADTFFPEIDMDEWDIVTVYYNNEVDYLDNNQVPYVRNRYTRRRIK